ncbi:MAG TPA: hypothetical protein VJC07_03770 [Candidatus Nanoarchaeia archaeon]|nr:hypothetical protein [Candidatus Nanoarchaeia archaeon]
MNNKKAQAALEFLMTYGWAILVVLIAIGALAYFGVLNPGRFLPSTCVLFPGVSCNDFKVNTTSITLIVRNGVGENLNPFTINVSSAATTCPNVGATASGGLSDGEQETLTIDCGASDPGSVGSRFKAALNVSYNTSAGVTHTRVGEIVSQIE